MLLAKFRVKKHFNNTNRKIESSEVISKSILSFSLEGG